MLKFYHEVIKTFELISDTKHVNLHLTQEAFESCLELPAN